MEMKPVKSSNIKAVGYDPASLVMQIDFANGTSYTYPDVPFDDFNKLANAESVGQHFNENIRSKFTGSKVGAKKKDAE